MANKKKSKLDEIEIDGGEFLLAVFKYGFLLLFLIGGFYAYFVAYDPEKQQYIQGSRQTVVEIQKVVTDLYKKQGFIYKSTEDKMDDVCIAMNAKHNKGGGSCVDPGFGYTKNFRLNKSKVEVYGMEKAPFEFEGVLVKEIIIDSNGEKGKNEIGVDRVPVRIYSSGRLGGMVLPVNCSTTSLKDWGAPYAKICAGAPDIDFLQTNVPFGYNIVQIGGPTGKSRLLNRNVPFYRADCSATGGELIAPDEYCDRRQFHWLPACYDEYPCSIDISTGKE